MPEYIPLTFGLEALYPPMTPVPAQAREFYMRLADPCRFNEFRLLGEGQGARLAEGGNRSLVIAPDRMTYQDDFTQSMFSTFVEDVGRIVKTLRETFHIPILIHSKILVRLLMPYQSEDNTVEFFQKTVMSSAASLFGKFARPLSGVGLKMVFPPTPDHHSNFNLRIEPYFRDLKMFFLENSAQFFDPIVNFADLTKNMENSYEFLKEKAGPFVLALTPPA